MGEWKSEKKAGTLRPKGVGVGSSACENPVEDQAALSYPGGLTRRREKESMERGKNLTGKNDRTKLTNFRMGGFDDKSEFYSGRLVCRG